MDSELLYKNNDTFSEGFSNREFLSSSRDHATLPDWRNTHFGKVRGKLRRLYGGGGRFLPEEKTQKSPGSEVGEGKKGMEARSNRLAEWEAG